jgi:hypothetical protein
MATKISLLEQEGGEEKSKILEDKLEDKEP